MSIQKTRQRYLLREFKKVHTDYSLENGGHWKRSWKKELKYADLVNGYWYWKGYRVVDLIKQR